MRTLRLLPLSLAAMVLVCCSKNKEPQPKPPKPPAITSFAPTSAYAGETLTVTGTNFSTTLSANTVTLNNIAATVTAATATELKVTVPDAECSGVLKVTVNGLSATASEPFAFLTQPMVTKFYNPSMDNRTSARHGQTIVIEGMGFSSTPTENTVTLNGIAAEITEASETELKVIVPKNLECSGDVKVTVAGYDAVTADKPFVYVPGVTVTTVAKNALLNQPSGLAFGSDGNLCVAGYNSNRIWKVTPGGEVTAWAGSGVVGQVDGLGTAAKFKNPYGIAADADGNLYVSERGNHTIRKIDPDGNVTTIAGAVSIAGDYNDGPGADARFSEPSGLVIDAAGHTLYVADASNHCIRKIDLTSDTYDVTTWVGSGKVKGWTDAQGSDARFNHPTGLDFDPQGNLYVADYFNHCIRKIDPQGNVTTLAGNRDPDSGGPYEFPTPRDGGPDEAQFNNPVGVAVDPWGNILVTDRFANIIRCVSPEGEVNTIAGLYGEDAGVTDGDASKARFWWPHEMAIDGQGAIYVSDHHVNANNIRKIVLE